MLHGGVYTIDAAGSTAEAVAVRNDEIILVGTDAEVLLRGGDRRAARVR